MLQVYKSFIHFILTSTRLIDSWSSGYARLVDAMLKRRCPVSINEFTIVECTPSPYIFALRDKESVITMPLKPSPWFEITELYRDTLTDDILPVFEKPIAVP